MRYTFVRYWPHCLVLSLVLVLMAAYPPRAMGEAAYQANRTPTRTPRATATKVPSATLKPTATPTPFHTPKPPPTATATPKALAQADPAQAAELAAEANALFLASDLAGAEAKLIEAIAADPESLAAHLQLTEVYLYWPHYWQQALQTAEAAVALAPEDATALAFLAWAQQGAHHFDDAKVTAQQAIELDPDNVMANIALADILSSVYEIDEAYATAQNAVELDENSASAWSTLGSIAATLEYLDEAGDAYTQAAELEPDFFAWQILLARHEIDVTGDTQLAREIAEPAIELQPDHPFVLSFLVDIALEENDFAGAEATCAKMLIYNQPTTPYPDAYSCLAGVKLLGEDNKGADYFQKLAEKIAPPERRDVTVIRMRLYNDAEECAAGRKLAEAWLKERPYSVLAMRMVGASYLCEEDFVKAEEYFQQALERLPRSLADARLLAGAYARDEKAAQARAVLNKVRSFAAQNPLYYQAVYEMNLFLGDMPAAISAAQRWQVLRPNNTEAMISLALAELFDGQIDAAQGYAEKALEANAQSSTLYAILGQAYSRRGNFAQAEEYLLQALGMSEDHFLARSFIAQLYLFSDNCDKAEPHIEWLQENDSGNEESLNQYQEMLTLCREQATRSRPDPATALEDTEVLREVEATLKRLGVDTRDIRFAEEQDQRSLFVAFTSDFAKESRDFSDVERELAIELARLLPRINSQPVGLILLSGSNDEPQNITYITTQAAIGWINGDLSDAEFEETWLKQSAENLQRQE